MILHTVNSRAIHAIGYDPERLILEIVFTGGGIYRYAHVPPQVAGAFLRAPSKGRYFQDHIRGAYAMHRLTKLRRKSTGARKSAGRKNREINPVTGRPTGA